MYMYRFSMTPAFNFPFFTSAAAAAVSELKHSRFITDNKNQNVDSVRFDCSDTLQSITVNAIKAKKKQFIIDR